MSYAAACLTEPLACAVHGIDVMDIHVGDVIAVNGAGPIGLFFTRLAVLRGAKVIVSDLGAGRLETAMQLGAWKTVNVSEVPDQVETVRALTPGGRGADAAIEAVGLTEVWEKTVQMVRPGGTVNLFGGAKGGTSFSVSTTLLHYSELTIKGVFHHTPHYVETALNLLASGQVPAEVFISGERPLADVVDALELMGRQQGIKYALVPPNAA
jgi:L-iditol 2-dehydrogenase